MKQPTPRQLEAYYWTHIVGLTQDEAGEKMGGLSQHTVSGLLKRFFDIRPQLRPDHRICDNVKNASSLSDCDLDHITTKF